MPTEMRDERINIEYLLLDPNNFRFQDRPGFVAAAEGRFHEETVQAKATQRMRDDVGALKKSILSNGYVPIERIIVRPCTSQPGKYVVIEGNRRVAAAKWILEDRSAGVEVPDTVIQSIATLPCVIVEENGPDQFFRACLMGIRHVSGISDWGGYQRAKLVTSLRDDLSKTAQEVADALGMTVHEVNRRYRAFKALLQMQDDEEFGEHAAPDMYPLFHEAISVPAVRDWLRWSDDTYTFQNQEDLKQFYQLLSPTAEEDSDQLSVAKIDSHKKVRLLGDILPKPEARRVLLDPGRKFEDAQLIVAQDQIAHAWASEVAEAITALESIGIADLKRLTAEDLDLLRRLSDKAQERIRDHQQLVARGG